MKSAKAPCPACQAQAPALQVYFLDSIPDLHVGTQSTRQMKAAALSYNGAPELVAEGAAARSIYVKWKVNQDWLLDLHRGPFSDRHRISWPALAGCR